MEPDNLIPFYIRHGMVPIRQAIVDRAGDFAEEFPFWDVISNLAQFANFRPPIPEYLQISQQLVTSIQRALTGQESAEEALDRAAGRVDRMNL